MLCGGKSSPRTNAILVTTLQSRYVVAGKRIPTGKINSPETVLNLRGKFKGFRFVQFRKDQDKMR